MSLLAHIALISQTNVSFGDVSIVSAALQKQVSRDLSQFWGINATVDAFQSLEVMPTGYWPILIVDQVKDAAGLHLDNQGQPYALVETGPTWSLTASHECLEMLVDPFGNRLVTGDSPMQGQGRVQFLVEVCDPSEDVHYAYSVNGVLVSDFYTPRYFDPMATPGTRYSYTGNLQQPRQVLKNGYLSWFNPSDNHWYQETFFNDNPEFRDLGPRTNQNEALRTFIDRATPERSLSHFERPPVSLQSSKAKAKALTQEINILLGL